MPYIYVPERAVDAVDLLVRSGYPATIHNSIEQIIAHQIVDDVKNEFSKSDLEIHNITMEFKSDLENDKYNPDSWINNQKYYVMELFNGIKEDK